MESLLGEEEKNGTQMKETCSGDLSNIPETTVENKNYDNETTKTDIWEEWEALMGKDLMMLRVTPESDKSNEIIVKDDLDPELLLSESKQQQQCIHAEYGDAVIVSYVGYCVDEDEFNEDPSFLTGVMKDHDNNNKVPIVECQDQLIILGDSDIIPGIELACRFLPKKECAWLKCHFKYGFGASGCRRAEDNNNKEHEYSVPPFTHLCFYVHIRSVIPTSDPEFPTQSFQIKIALSKKQLGNDAYQHEWSEEEEGGGHGKSKALKLYGSGSELMIQLIKEIRDKNSKTNDNDIEEEKPLRILLDCLNNISAVHYRAKDYGKAKEAATAVLLWDVNNQRALCRGAKSAMFDPAGSFEESEMAIEAAEQLNPHDSEVQSLRVLLNKKKRQHKQREKAMYGKMAKGIKSKTDPNDVKIKSTTIEIKDEKQTELNPNEITKDLKDVETKSSKEIYDFRLPLLIQSVIIAVVAVWCFRLSSSTTIP